jgi:hypothetical protein
MRDACSWDEELTASFLPKQLRRPVENGRLGPACRSNLPSTSHRSGSKVVPVPARQPFIRVPVCSAFSLIEVVSSATWLALDSEPDSSSSACVYEAGKTIMVPFGIAYPMMVVSTVAVHQHLPRIDHFSSLTLAS